MRPVRYLPHPAPPRHPVLDGRLPPSRRSLLQILLRRAPWRPGEIAGRRHRLARCAARQMTIKTDFIQLLDRAIACSESLSREVLGTDNAWMAEDATTARTQFQRIKNDALADHLPPSNGAGLGVTRALGEWAPEELYAAGKAVEDFYRANWM